MATGRRAFSGTTTAVIFHAILAEMPAPPLEVNPELPTELGRIINRLLEKDVICVIRAVRTCGANSSG
jgi:hypothetical protein